MTETSEPDSVQAVYNAVRAYMDRVAETYVADRAEVVDAFDGVLLWGIRAEDVDALVDRMGMRVARPFLCALWESGEVDELARMRAMSVLLSPRSVDPAREEALDALYRAHTGTDKHGMLALAVCGEGYSDRDDDAENARERTKLRGFYDALAKEDPQHPALDVEFQRDTKFPLLDRRWNTHADYSRKARALHGALHPEDPEEGERLREFARKHKHAMVFGADVPRVKALYDELDAVEPSDPDRAVVGGDVVTEGLLMHAAMRGWDGPDAVFDPENLNAVRAVARVEYDPRDVNQGEAVERALHMKTRSLAVRLDHYGTDSILRGYDPRYTQQWTEADRDDALRRVHMWTTNERWRDEAEDGQRTHRIDVEDAWIVAYRANHRVRGFDTTRTGDLLSTRRVPPTLIPALSATGESVEDVLGSVDTFRELNRDGGFPAALVLAGLGVDDDTALTDAEWDAFCARVGVETA